MTVARLTKVGYVGYVWDGLCNKGPSQTGSTTPLGRDSNLEESCSKVCPPNVGNRFSEVEAKSTTTQHTF